MGSQKKKNWGQQISLCSLMMMSSLNDHRTMKHLFLSLSLLFPRIVTILFTYNLRMNVFSMKKHET